MKKCNTGHGNLKTKTHKHMKIFKSHNSWKKLNLSIKPQWGKSVGASDNV